MFNDVFPKYVVEEYEWGTSLIIGNVKYHSQMTTNKENVRGGGWWRRLDREKFTATYGLSQFDIKPGELKDEMMIFHMDSHDFGRAKLEDVQKAFDNDNVFTNRLGVRSISNKYNYFYDTGTELVYLRKQTE